MNTAESDQAAAQDRDLLAPRVASYFKALTAQGLNFSVALALVTQYQTTLQQITYASGKDGSEEDLPDPP